MDHSDGISHHDEDLIACVVENRGREVAIATMSPLRTHVLQTYVCQDSQSYAETIDLLCELRPREVLIHDGTRKKPLAQKIQLLSRSAEMGARTCVPVYVARSYFDQDRGVELLKKLSMDSLDSDLFDSYIFLASAHCLLKYMESTCSVRFPPHCLKVIFGYGWGGRLVIDRHSCKDLELISNARTGSQKEGTLYGIINKTKTDVGAKALKANLLAPLTDKVTIEGRLALIELFIAGGGPDAIDNLQGTLGCLTEMDRMLGGIATIAAAEDLATAKKMIHTVVLLKTFLRLAPSLVDDLDRLLPVEKEKEMDEERNVQEEEEEEDEGNAAYALVRAIIAALSPPVFSEISALVQEYISESTIHERSTKTRRLQECFAVNPGICGLLDVARKTFLQSVEDIYDLAGRYAKEYGLPDLRVSYTPTRGYFLLLPATLADLPSIFIQSTVVKKSLQCTTEEIASLSRAAAASRTQCLILTCNVLRDNLLGKVREYVDSLFKAVEAVALLDMVLGFADLVLSDEGTWTRPELTLSNNSGGGGEQLGGTLAIKQGRHPVVSQFVPKFVPNDAFAGRFANLVVVSGVNGSGKTVFVKSIALIVILAQMGCFVPCEAASIPIRDRLLTSLSTADDMETNLSTFMAEMRRAAYVLGNLTNNSLVIIDELGRGTSTMDGSALSFAIAEALLATSALSFFVTHYRLLIGGGLSSTYGNVRQVHLAASLSEETRTLAFQHHVEEGPSEIKSGYGIALAAHVGFPEQVLHEAERVKRILEAEEERKKGGTGGGGEERQQQTEDHEPAWKYDLLRRLMMLKDCLVDGGGGRGGEDGGAVTIKKTPEEGRQLLQALRTTVQQQQQQQNQQQDGIAMEEGAE